VSWIVAAHWIPFWYWQDWTCMGLTWLAFGMVAWSRQRVQRANVELRRASWRLRKANARLLRWRQAERTTLRNIADTRILLRTYNGGTVLDLTAESAYLIARYGGQNGVYHVVEVPGLCLSVQLPDTPKPAERGSANRP
jgi:hypothetical protein